MTVRPRAALGLATLAFCAFAMLHATGAFAPDAPIRHPGSDRPFRPMPDRAGQAYRAATLGNVPPTYSLQLMASTGDDDYWKVVAGDFNGDGRQDIAALAAIQGSNDVELRVLLQDAAGNLGPPVAYSYPSALSAGWFVGLTVADLDEDGRSDLVLAQRYEPGLTYALSLPGGGFEWRQDLWATALHTSPVVATDVDRDGHVDLVAHLSYEYYGGKIVTYFGDGHGNLFRHASVAIRDTKARLATGSLDGDAWPDLLTVGQTYGELSPRVFRNSGAGTFQPPHELLARWFEGNDAAFVADFTGDGRADAAVVGASHAANRVVVYPGQADGSLAAQPTLYGIPPGFYSSIASTSADLDGDGRVDLLQVRAAGPGAPQPTLSLQDAYGLRYPVELALVPPNPNKELYFTDVAVGDFNGDGVRDIVYATGGQGLLVMKGVLTPYTGAGGLPGAPSVLSATDGSPSGQDPQNGVIANVGVAAAVDNGGTPITGYTVYSVGGGGWDMDAGTGPGVHRIAGLEDGNSYTFAARATNAAGLGPRSAPGAPITFGVLQDPAAFPRLMVGWGSQDNFEGDLGPREMQIYFSLDRPAPAGGTSFDVSTSDISATAGQDYVAMPKRTLFFPEGQAEIAAPIPFTVLGDRLAEGVEMFSLDLSAVQRLDTEGQPHRSMGIGDDDDPNWPHISVGNLRVLEGNAGTKVVDVTVLLSQALPGDVVFDLDSRSAGEVVPGNDYDFAGGVGLAIPAGQTQATFPMTIHGDTDYEHDEVVEILLRNLRGQFVNPMFDIGKVTIANDEPVPSISFDDVSVTEGDIGPKQVLFKLKLSAPMPNDIEFSAVTVQGTALDGRDFVPRYVWSQVIGAGETEATIAVDILTDQRYENDETFSLRLEDVFGVALPKDTAVATLVNDDAAPEVRVGDVSAIEGTAMQAFIALDRPSDLPVSMVVRTSPGTAAPGIDYTPVQSTLVIPAGSTFAVVTVPTLQDNLPEDNETFVVEIASATNSTLVDGQGLARITNDDIARLVISDAQVVEGNSGVSTAWFDVRLDAPIPVPVVFDIGVIAGGTAGAGDRVAQALSNVRLDPGRTLYRFGVQVLGDTQVEGDETFLVKFANASNAVPYIDTATGTIVDDDAPALVQALRAAQRRLPGRKDRGAR